MESNVDTRLITAILAHVVQDQRASWSHFIKKRPKLFSTKKEKKKSWAFGKVLPSAAVHRALPVSSLQCGERRVLCHTC